VGFREVDRLSLLEEACEWASTLTLAQVPQDVRDLAVAQLMSQAAAAEATRDHPVSARLEGAIPGDGWAERAASLALLTMALDFDETAFAGHLGHSCALPVLLCAAANGCTGEEALVAQVAASEVAARLTAAVTLGSARGQTAAHTHAVGAAVGFAVALKLTPGQMAVAVSLAMAQTRKVLLPAFMGSDAKFWVAAGPVLEAARCVREAERGARGYAGLVEASGGVLEELADMPLPEALGGYGERWHLRTLSIKSVPGCAYLTSIVELAAGLGPLDLRAVERIEGRASIFTLGMEAQSAPFMAGPNTPLPALGFSSGYNIAAALESGSLGVEDLHGSRLASEERWRVARALRLEHDEELTVAALGATAPVGGAIAWAGDRARAYLAARGATERMVERVIQLAQEQADPTLARSSKRMGSALRVTMRSGTVLEDETPAASGCCQESVASRLALANGKMTQQFGDRAPGLIDDLGILEDLGRGELAGMALIK
jgi:2-methylcitrate dehydratase PrpD